VKLRRVTALSNSPTILSTTAQFGSQDSIFLVAQDVGFI